MSDLNRGDALKMLAGIASMAAGLSPARGASADDAPAYVIGQRPPPRLDGELRVDEQSRSAAADDFGHIVHKTPVGVLLPGSVDDVAETIRWAGQQHHRVVAQGQQHSVYGRAQADGGIVIDMSQLRSIHAVGADRVVVDAGATWRDVLTSTLPRQLTPPVLANYLDLSVGGTLVVGGVGDTTSRYGVQSDNVLELEVVTGNGRRVKCSPRRKTELFDAVRAGLGQVALITKATLRLVPAPDTVRRYVLMYPDVPSLLHDQRTVTADERFDAMQGAVLPTPGGWRYRLDAVAHFSGSRPPDDDALLAGLSDDRSTAEITDLTYLEYLDRLAPLEQMLRSNGQWFHPHPWLTTFIGDSTVEPTVADELARLTPADLGTFGQIVLSAFRREAVTSPLVRLPADDLVYAFNLIRFPTTADDADARRLVDANRAIYERVLGAGGSLYPVSAFPMSPAAWQRHFGPAWNLLRDAKKRFDTRRVLTPGYDVFS